VEYVVEPNRSQMAALYFSYVLHAGILRLQTYPENVLRCISLATLITRTVHIFDVRVTVHRVTVHRVTVHRRYYVR
jgi:hypothetical protein